MIRNTKNRGLRTASGLIAVLLLLSFSIGSVFASNVAPVQADQMQVVVKQSLSPFAGVSFFEATRPATAWETIIWSASVLPGHKPLAEQRCNSPTVK
jgi:hypothetical protein